MRIIKGINSFIPTLVWATVILVLSVVPSDELPDTDIEFSDKIGHFVVYLILSFLLVRDYRKNINRLISPSAWLLFFLLTCGYGIIIEILQACCIPSRYGELIDGIANAAGAIFGLILAFLRR